MLSEVDKSFLAQVAESEELREAISRHIDSIARGLLLEERPTDTNELLGERYRAYRYAREIIDRALLDVLKYKGREIIKNKPNLER